MQSPSGLQGSQGGVDLCFLSPQTDVQTTNTGLVHCMMCMFTSQLLLILVALIHRGMARLSWQARLTWVTGLSICSWSPSQVLTRPNIY